MFTSKTIALNVVAADWEAAVRAAGELLVNAGMAESRYIEGMLRTVHEMGPYIVIMPGVAIPHARPEDGALREGFSLITLDQPIVFGNPDNDPVWVVIAFCAPASSAHVETLRQLAEFLAQPDIVARLRAAKNPQDILAYFKSDDGMSSKVS